MAKSKILIVDDHPVFREGVVRIIDQQKDMAVCAEAENAVQALKQMRSLKPDLVLVDISLDGMNGLDLTKSLREQFPAVSILMLSMHKELLYAERALRAGANGYIMKRESGHNLVSAIRRILLGQIYVSEEMNARLLQRLSHTGRDLKASPVDVLSDREFEIFQLIGNGYGTRQIADELHMSIKTVESHRGHIREKLNLRTTFELVQNAIHWKHIS
jgi:DNA-binding NarL/FixJ family response regulator